MFILSVIQYENTAYKCQKLNNGFSILQRFAENTLDVKGYGHL